MAAFLPSMDFAYLESMLAAFLHSVNIAFRQSMMSGFHPCMDIAFLRSMMAAFLPFLVDVGVEVYFGDGTCALMAAFLHSVDTAFFQSIMAAFRPSMDIAFLRSMMAAFLPFLVDAGVEVDFGDGTCAFGGGVVASADALHVLWVERGVPTQSVRQLPTSVEVVAAALRPFVPWVC